MKRFQAVIFDMDGVIVDSEPLHERAFHEVLRTIGHAGPVGLDFADYVGRSDFELWRDFVRRHAPACSLEELLALKRERVLAILREAQPVFPGLPELVETLAAHFRLGLASGSEHPVIQVVLSLRGLRRFFPVVVSGTDVKHGKPAPDIFLHAAALLGVPPQQCVVIEDSKPGVAAGLAAGMTVVAITNTHPARELAAATHVVATCDEIGRLLLPT
jgi:HAD superfamily hydrolase (TIGR01509 family)